VGTNLAFGRAFERSQQEQMIRVRSAQRHKALSLSLSHVPSPDSVLNMHRHISSHLSLSLSQPFLWIIHNPRHGDRPSFTCAFQSDFFLAYLFMCALSTVCLSSRTSRLITSIFVLLVSLSCKQLNRAPTL
jgi:hypothetical protein